MIFPFSFRVPRSGFRVLFVASTILFSALPSFAAPPVPPITALAFAPDGQSLLVGSQAGIEIRSYPELRPLKKLETRLVHVHDLAFSPGGELLAAAGGAPGEWGEVELWSWPTGKRLASAKPHRDLVYRVAWREGDASLIAASADGTASLLDGQLGTTATLKGHSRGLLAAVVLPKDAGIVTAGLDQSIRTWDAATAKIRRVQDQHTAAVVDLALRPGEHAIPTLASAGADKTVRFWQPTIGRLVRFARLPSEPLALAWLHDGSRVAAACVDGKVYLVDPETAVVHEPLAGIERWAYSIAASPDGKSLVVGGAAGELRIVTLPAASP